MESANDSTRKGKRKEKDKETAQPPWMTWEEAMITRAEIELESVKMISRRMGITPILKEGEGTSKKPPRWRPCSSHKKENTTTSVSFLESHGETKTIRPISKESFFDEGSRAISVSFFGSGNHGETKAGPILRECRSICEGASKIPPKWKKIPPKCKPSIPTKEVNTTSVPFLRSSTQPYKGHEKSKFDKGKTAMFPSVPFMYDLSLLRRDWFHNYSNISLQPNQKNESKMLNHDNYSCSNSVPDMETMGIYKTTNSVELDHANKEKATELTPWLDINLEPSPDLHAAGPSSSNAQSLKSNALLTHVDIPTPKSNNPDPTTSCAKRLKMTSSNSTNQDTKISNLPENISCDKEIALFRSILNNNITNSAQQKEPKLSNIQEQGKKMVHSHTWIKTWLRNGSQMSKKKPEATVVCDPQSTQLPDLAPVTAIEKARSGTLPQCEFEKKGNIILWKTKSL